MKNARIETASIEIEDHGFLTCWLHLRFENSGQGFGGHALTRFINGKSQGTAYGMEFIRRVLATVGVNSWEELPGKIIRIQNSPEKIHSIGHAIEDIWFTPTTDLAHLIKGDL